MSVEKVIPETFFKSEKELLSFMYVKNMDDYFLGLRDYFNQYFSKMLTEPTTEHTVILNVLRENFPEILINLTSFPKCLAQIRSAGLIWLEQYFYTDTIIKGTFGYTHKSEILNLFLSKDKQAVRERFRNYIKVKPDNYFGTVGYFSDSGSQEMKEWDKHFLVDIKQLFQVNPLTEKELLDYADCSDSFFLFKVLGLCENNLPERPILHVTKQYMFDKIHECRKDIWLGNKQWIHVGLDEILDNTDIVQSIEQHRALIGFFNFTYVLNKKYLVLEGLKNILSNKKPPENMKILLENFKKVDYEKYPNAFEHCRNHCTKREFLRKIKYMYNY